MTYDEAVKRVHVLAEDWAGECVATCDTLQEAYDYDEMGKQYDSFVPYAEGLRDLSDAAEIDDDSLWAEFETETYNVIHRHFLNI